jgi:hypothetical protein
MSESGKATLLKINETPIRADWRHDYVQEYLDPGDGSSIEGLKLKSRWEITVGLDDYMKVSQLPQGQHISIMVGDQPGGSVYFVGGKPYGGSVTLYFDAEPPARSFFG